MSFAVPWFSWQNSAEAELGQGRVPHQAVLAPLSFFTCFHFFTSKAKHFFVFSLSVLATFVETQKPPWPCLPQHVLPPNCSKFLLDFPAQPLLPSHPCIQSKQVSDSFAFCSQAPDIASSLEMTGFACMQRLHSKETRTALNVNVELLSVMSPPCSCSRSFLSGMGQQKCNSKAGIKALTLLHILKPPGYSVICFLAHSFSDLGVYSHSSKEMQNNLANLRAWFPWLGDQKQLAVVCSVIPRQFTKSSHLSVFYNHQNDTLALTHWHLFFVVSPTAPIAEDPSF